MRVLVPALLAALWAPPQQQPPQPAEPPSVRALLGYIDRSEDKAAEKQLVAFAALENPVDTLADAFHEGLKLIGDLKKEEERDLKWVEDVRIVYDSKGFYKRGNALEELKAREALAKVRQRMAMADDFVPRVCTTLHGLKTEAAIKALTAWAVSGADWYFRAQAVAALASVPAAKQALAGQLKKETEPGVKVALLDALRPRIAEDKSLQSDFAEFVKDPYWQVQVAALQGLRIAAPKTYVPDLIAAMKSAGGRIRYELNETLKAITDVDKHEYSAWKAWWDEHGPEVLNGTYTPNISERAAAPGQSTFYGMSIHSTHLVLTIDVSTSMMQAALYKPKDPGPDPFSGSSRADVAKYELKRLLRQLPHGVRMNICTFMNFVHFFDEGKMVTLDEKTRGQMLKWTDAIALDSGTSTWDALHRIFEIGGGTWYDKIKPDTLDTIVLLTDGEPTGRVQAKKLFLEKLDHLNRFRKIAIHCIGIEPPINGEDLLKEIAAQSQSLYLRR